MRKEFVWLTALIVYMALTAEMRSANADVIVYTYEGLGSGTLPDSTPFAGETVRLFVETDTTTTADFAGRIFNLPHAWQIGAQLFTAIGSDGYIAINVAGTDRQGGDDGLTGAAPRFSGLADGAASIAFGNPTPFAAVPFTTNSSVGGSVEVTSGTLTFSSLQAQTLGAELGSLSAVPEPSSLALVGLAAVGVGFVHRRKQRAAKAQTR